MTVALRLLAPMLALALSGTAQAAIIVVNTLDDELNSDGDCSLREAVQAANTNVAVDACTAGHSTGTGDVILFAPALAGGEIPISQNLVITQALNIIGLDQLTLRRSSASTMIRVDMANPAHDFRLSHVTMIDGNGGSQTTGSGSAVQLRQADQVTLSNVVFRNNAYSAVGRWQPDYPDRTVNALTVEDCLFESNNATSAGFGGQRGGGAIALHTLPQLTITRSTFRNNGRMGGGRGGALRLSRVGNATISDSTFIRNGTNSNPGGAIHAEANAGGTTLSVTRSTFSRNRGSSAGDIHVGRIVNAQISNSTFYDTQNAIHLAEDASASILLSTFVGSISPDGFVSSESTGIAGLARTVLFGSASHPLCTTSNGGTLVSSGNNRFQQGDTSCGFVASDQHLADPALLPLEDYGGFVPVMLPRIDSPLIDAGGASCAGVTVDARNRPRPVSSTGSGTPQCDIGAAEWNPAFDDYLFKHGFNY